MRKNKTFTFRQEANKFYDEKPRKPQENRFDPECTRQDRCPKFGDSLHREGFRCPASKQHCKICNKIGHLLACATRREMDMRITKFLGSPKPHQLKIGSVYTRDSLCGQSDVESSDNSFCLQLEVNHNKLRLSLQYQSI